MRLSCHSFACVSLLAFCAPPVQSQVRRAVINAPITDATIRTWKQALATNPGGMHGEWNQIPPERAVAELRPFLFDVDPSMRAAAASAIGQLHAKPASGAVAIAAGIDSASDVETKVRLSQAVSSYGPAAAPAVPAMTRALKPAEAEGVADQIVSDLTFVGPAAAPAIGSVVSMLEDSTTLYNGQNMLSNAQFLALVGPAIAPYGPRLVRVMALGRLGGNWGPRLDAAIAGTGQATTDALIAALATPPKDVSNSIGSELIATLGLTHKSAALPVLLHYATTKPKKYGLGTRESLTQDADLRVDAITALGLMGNAGAPALSELTRIAASPSAGPDDFDHSGLVDAAQKAIHAIRIAQMAH